MKAAIETETGSLFIQALPGGEFKLTHHCEPTRLVANEAELEALLREVRLDREYPEDIWVIPAAQDGQWLISKSSRHGQPGWVVDRYEAIGNKSMWDEWSMFFPTLTDVIKALAATGEEAEELQREARRRF